MKLILNIALPVVCLALPACTHIMVLGHKSAYDVNAEFSGDPIAPVSLNAGFEGRSFAAVPPKKAVPWHENFDEKKLPGEDVMSSLLELKIEKVEREKTATGNVLFDYVTSGATGLAAEAAVGGGESSSPTALEGAGGKKDTTQAKQVAQRIKDITSSGDSAFGKFPKKNRSALPGEPTE